MKDRKSSWSIAWSQATVQRCIQMPPFTKETWRIKTFMRTVFKEHADIDAVIHFVPTHWSLADH